MTRLEAWNELRESITELRDNDGTGTQQEICKFLANLMNVLDKQITDGWIPVSEKLPKKGEYGKVLVTYIPSGGTLWTTVIIAHYSDLMGISKPSFHVGEVGKESFQNITEQVIAWMPLPESYKAESEDKE